MKVLKFGFFHYQTQQDRKYRNTTANSRLPQVAVTWLIEGLCSYSASVQVDSLVLLNRHLRQAAKRCASCQENDNVNNKQ